MLIIPVKDGESIDRALKKYKRKFYHEVSVAANGKVLAKAGITCCVDVDFFFYCLSFGT